MMEPLNFNKLKLPDSSEIFTKFISEAQKINNYIIEKRRWFHQFPELFYREFKTSAYIKQSLDELEIPWIETAETGVIGLMDTKRPGKSIALRADMDALELNEQNKLPFKSKHKGIMHACGHDGHMAILLGTAKIIKQNPELFRGNIKLIFQPAEEHGAGAKTICDENYLDKVDFVFGLHLGSELPSGTIGYARDKMNASADSYQITVKGKGGHAAFPAEFIDPTSVGIDIYNALHKLVSREKEPSEPIVISLPYLEGSNATNIIPEEFVLKGTLRTFNEKLRNYLIQRIKEITVNYSKAWRCEGKFELLDIYYPPLINTKSLVEKITPYLAFFGNPVELEPSMGSEDFSFYLKKIKGAYFVLGSGNKEKGTLYPHHHPRFDIDEDVLYRGSALFSFLAYYFGQKQS